MLLRRQRTSRPLGEDDPVAQGFAACSIGIDLREAGHGACRR